MAYLLGTSLLLILVAAAGHCAVRHKSLPILLAHIALGVALFIACIGCVWVCFFNSSAVFSWVQGMDDRTLGKLASWLGVSGNKASILSGLQGNMQKIGLACGVVLILQVLSLLSAAYFGCATRAWKQQFGMVIRKSAAPRSGATV